eukprot:868407-Pyramimonas_sp.AAC.1
MADSMDDDACLRDLAMAAKQNKGAATVPPPQDSSSSPDRGRPAVRQPRMQLRRTAPAATEA